MAGYHLPVAFAVLPYPGNIILPFFYFAGMNKQVQILSSEVLSDNWYLLKKITYSSGAETHTREVYDRGNGATILLYNQEQQTVILTQQFRLPTFLNGNKSGLLIEACAGLLDKDEPEECIRRETEEETGYRIRDVQKVFEAYMSPGSVTEILHFFIAAYTKDMKLNAGGGIAAEDEHIEVLEFSFEQTLNMISTGGIKDAKTIMLLQYLRLQAIL